MTIIKKICSIICGAPCAGIDKNLIEGLVIAADRGLDYALAAGITPDIAVGDFDSAESSVPSGVECVRVSPIKDDTDTILAANTAIEHGCDELRFFCALGGRLDHTFANIQVLYDLINRGIHVKLYGDNECAYLLRNETVEIPRYDGYLSVFSYGESAVVSESGVKYPIDRYLMKNSFPLGVSNEITAPAAIITAHEGMVIIIEVRKSVK